MTAPTDLSRDLLIAFQNKDGKAFQALLDKVDELEERAKPQPWPPAMARMVDSDNCTCVFPLNAARRMTFGVDGKCRCGTCGKVATFVALAGPAAHAGTACIGSLQYATLGGNGAMPIGPMRHDPQGGNGLVTWLNHPAVGGVAPAPTIRRNAEYPGEQLTPKPPPCKHDPISMRSTVECPDCVRELCAGNLASFVTG